MNPLLQMDAGDIKKFIYDRVSTHQDFKAVIAVSVQKYPSEFSAVVWVGQEPDPGMRQYAYELEGELENLGVPCNIVIKTDRELPFGGTYRLRTKKGEFSYRYYRLDVIKDEDIVYLFTLHRGKEIHRFRVSLSGTLGSMLRMRNRLHEARIEEVYLDRIRELIEKTDLTPDAIQNVMFDSRDLKRFGGD